MLTRCSLPFSSRSPMTGFTLIELLVATAMSVIIVGGAFVGLIALMQNRSKAVTNTTQEETLNLALDLIGDDIRAARRINSTGAAVTTAAAAIAAASSTTLFNPSLSGAAGTYVLYLEIPLQGPSSCPSGTDLATQVPPSFDRVLYDIRTSDGTWTGPNVMYRYGRLPRVDGSLDACNLPQQDQALVEAIAPTTPLDCLSPNLLSGTNGFWACVAPVGNTAKLKLNSTVTDTSGTPRTYSLESQVSTRGI
jgi:type II secretory pathway pseudopilin PulG